MGISASLKLLNSEELLDLDKLKSALSAYYLSIRSLRESLKRITLVENDLDFDRVCYTCFYDILPSQIYVHNIECVF